MLPFCLNCLEPTVGIQTYASVAEEEDLVIEMVPSGAGGAALLGFHSHFQDWLWALEMVPLEVVPLEVYAAMGAMLA